MEHNKDWNSLNNYTSKNPKYYYTIDNQIYNYDDLIYNDIDLNKIYKINYNPEIKANSFVDESIELETIKQKIISENIIKEKIYPIYENSQKDNFKILNNRKKRKLRRVRKKQKNNDAINEKEESNIIEWFIFCYFIFVCFLKNYE
jgi:hypothetical protein